MEISRADFKILFIYSLAAPALFLYLSGFFPGGNTFDSKDFSRGPYTERAQKNSGFSRLVLIVIDALRYDFVLPEKNEKYMPFTTTSIMNNESCLIKLRAEAPTVTMPRLKAMTSGMVPTYFDVVKNFISSEFRHDSFIQQAIHNNYKIIFYGDETWINLFPNSFIRSEGTNSFFASDFEEVDQNVTRHLDEEFKKDDWDFLILHYLGLDHIGHMDGPTSPLIRPKLEEMDSVIFKIFQNVKKLEEHGKRTLLLVTSDHGMKNSGGHGGVTTHEIILPLLSVGKSCYELPGWPTNYTAEQIDLASTISTAFGFTIPSNNIGKIIPALLDGMKSEVIFEALNLNRIDLNRKAGLLQKDAIKNEISESYNWEPVITKSDSSKLTISELLFHELSRLSTSLRRATEFNHMYLNSSTVFLWTMLLIQALLSAYTFMKPQKATHYFLLLGTCLSGFSLASTSFIEEEHQTWYFFWMTFCVLGISEATNFKQFSVLRNIKSTLPWFAIMISHRILRKLNQTGDKWAMLPDIKGFLNSTENHSWLILVYVSGLLALFWCAVSEGCIKYQLINFGFALVVSFAYRVAVSSFQLDIFSPYPKSRGSWECRVFWTLASVFAVQSARNKTPIYLLWALVSCNLLKPHNVVLLPLEIFTSRCLNKYYHKYEDTLWNSMAHYWMGHVFYFYQGNGNSISNIDVSAGFVGLEEYKPIYSGSMIAAHTNSAHIMAFLLSPRCNLTTSISRLFTLTLYCTFLLFHLNHLFIWSVFSPKLLYEINFYIVVLSLICFNSVKENLKFK